MVFDRQVVDAAISYLISLVEQVLPIFKWKFYLLALLFIRSGFNNKDKLHGNFNVPNDAIWWFLIDKLLMLQFLI
jgi:hypothetical protein